jgi:UDP-glucose 4-epimerase
MGILKTLTKRETEVAYKPMREGDVKHSCADIRLARKTLGYAPKVKLADGLRELLALSGVISAPRPSLYPRT